MARSARARGRTARERGELPGGLDPDRLALEPGVTLAGTDIVSVLHGDDAAIRGARTAVRERPPSLAP